MSNNTRYHLIIKSLKGKVSTAEKQELDNWVNASKENANVYEEMKSIWNLSEVSKFDPSQLNMEEEYASFQKKLNKNRSNKIIPLRKRRNNWLKIAASVALVLASTLIYFQLNKTSSTPPISLNTAIDQTQQLALSDGTQVWLNENSRIDYPSKFDNKKRSVRLHGEAFFDVESNPKQPFEIKLSNGYITVLGTAFNVRDIEQEDLIEITVKEGSVRFQFSEDSESYVLEQNDRLSLNRTTLQVSIQKDDHLNALAWHSKKLTFENTPMPHAIKELERYFKADIEVNKLLYNCNISSTLPIDDLEGFLKSFEIMFDANFQNLGDNKYVISDGRRCD